MLILFLILASLRMADVPPGSSSNPPAKILPVKLK